MNINEGDAVAIADGVGRIFHGEPGLLSTEAQWERAAAGPLRRVPSMSARSFQDYVKGPQIRRQFYGRLRNLVELVGEGPNGLEFGTQFFTNPNHPTVLGWLARGILGAWDVFPGHEGIFSKDFATSMFEARTAPRDVRQGVANGYGLLDMGGNVWERVGDRYGPYEMPREGGELIDPIHIEGGDSVLRGGSWSVNPRHVRVAVRFINEAGKRWSNRGFRVAFPQD